MTESRRAVDEGHIDCPACGLVAERVPCSGLPELTGYRPRPTKEAPINLSRAIEAQHELVYTAEKHNIRLPDLYKAAQERVKRGDAVAIK